jgi:hypothetical protein
MTDQGSLDAFESGVDIRHGLPPIVGADGGSAWLRTPGHVRFEPTFVPSDVGDGIYLGVDVQPDSPSEQTVLGTMRTGGSALLLVLNAGGVPRRLSVLLRDEDGRSLLVDADGSGSVARRLVITAQPRVNAIQVFEIQPWSSSSPATPLPSRPMRQESPTRFVFDQPVALGGCYEDGQPSRSFAGRVAELYVGRLAAPGPDVAVLAAASGNPTNLSHMGLAEPSAEIRQRFMRDLAQLRSWVGRPMTPETMDAASLLFYRWLFSRTPVLATICRSYGIQLWLPGQSARARRYEEAVLDLSPTILVRGTRQPDGAMGSEWATLDNWRSQPVFSMGSTHVSGEQFIKFVRNKLGAGHFDEADRTRWQRDLLSVTEGLRLMDQTALEFQMNSIATEVLIAVSISRLEPLIRSSLARLDA